MIGRVQQRVLSALMSGNKMTALRISQIAYVTDPRGHIRALRKKGIISKIFGLNQWFGVPGANYII